MSVRKIIPQRPSENKHRRRDGQVKATPPPPAITLPYRRHRHAGICGSTNNYCTCLALGLGSSGGRMPRFVERSPASYATVGDNCAVVIEISILFAVRRARASDARPLSSYYAVVRRRCRCHLSRWRPLCLSLTTFVVIADATVTTLSATLVAVIDPQLPTTWHIARERIYCLRKTIMSLSASGVVLSFLRYFVSKCKPHLVVSLLFYVVNS